MQVEVLTGPAVEAALGDLAALRIAVFRAFPYLYDGDLAYETQYMRSYRDNPRAVLVVARDGERIVGAATGMPLVDHGDAAQLCGVVPAVERVFYCAESVLLPDYRGRGLGHAFFDQREAYARAGGFDLCAFCAVIRPADHPLRPAGYRPLEGFWRKRGYAPAERCEARFSWKDVDQPTETTKSLQLWVRALTKEIP